MGESAMAKARVTSEEEVANIIVDMDADLEVEGSALGGGRAMKVIVRRTALLLVLLLGLAATAVVAGRMFVKARHDWDRRWQSICEERGESLRDTFTKSANTVKIVTEFMRIYSSARLRIKDVTFQQMEDKKFKEFGYGSEPLMPMVTGISYNRRVLDSERALYENKTGKPIMGYYTFQPMPTFEEYAVIEFSTWKNTPSTVGMDIMHHPITIESYMWARDTGEFGVTMPFELQGDLLQSVSLPIYEVPLANNATVEDRRALCRGYLSTSWSVTTIIKQFFMVLQGADNMQLKVVDITGKKPIAMFYPNVTNGLNLTRDDFRYHAPLSIMTEQRKFEVWCRPLKSQKFIPVAMIAWTLGTLGATLLLVHILWLGLRSIEFAEIDYLKMKRLNGEMALAKKNAEAADVAKSAFLATVSHEIRTPMNGVLGMLSLLIETSGLSPTQIDYAQTAFSSGKALLSLVNDVLDLSKIEAGHMQLESIPFSVSAELDDVLSMFAGKAREKEIELAALVHSPMPRLVVGDPTRFRQVLINIVGNAMKFCSKGHIFVRIMALPDDANNAAEIARLHRNGMGPGFSTPKGTASVDSSRKPSINLPFMRSRQGSNAVVGEQLHSALSQIRSSLDVAGTWAQTLSGLEVANKDCSWSTIKQAIIVRSTNTLDNCDRIRLLVWVEDSGVGIPLSAQSRMFKPFQQADSSTSRKYGGTGIGMSICKNLVALMNGRISFASRPDFGTTFRFDISLNVHRWKPPVQQTTSAFTSLTSLQTLNEDGESEESGDVVAMTPSGRFTRTSSARFPLLGSARLPGAPPPGAPRETTEEEPTLVGMCVLCMDRNPLRAEVTAGYLRRIGMVVEVSVGWESGSDPRLSGHASKRNGGNSEVENVRIVLVELELLDMRVKAFGPTVQFGAASVSESRVGGVAAPSSVPSKADLQRGLSRLQAKEPRAVGVPVALIINKQEPSLESAALSAGFAGTILKPLRKGTILACLLEVFGVKASKAGQSGKEACVSILTAILKGKKFLVVDDNMINRKVASKTLVKYGLEVVCLDSGEKSLEALKGSHTFDLVFMDIQMPGMDGYETVQNIRKLETGGQSTGPSGSHTPVVALTADVMKGTLETCLNAGMDGLVSKPIVEDQLLHTIEQIFGTPVNSEQS